MKTVKEERKLKIQTVYLNATVSPPKAHFTFEHVGDEWDLYKRHALELSIESPFYEPLLNAWKEQRFIGVEATYKANYNLQKTEMFDITGVESLDYAGKTNS